MIKRAQASKWPWPGFQYQFCSFFCVWPWASHWLFWVSGFFIYKMGAIGAGVIFQLVKHLTCEHENLNSSHRFYVKKSQVCLNSRLGRHGRQAGPWDSLTDSLAYLMSSRPSKRWNKVDNVWGSVWSCPLASIHIWHVYIHSLALTHTHIHERAHAHTCTTPQREKN